MIAAVLRVGFEGQKTRFRSIAWSGSRKAPRSTSHTMSGITTQSKSESDFILGPRSLSISQHSSVRLSCSDSRSGGWSLSITALLYNLKKAGI